MLHFTQCIEESFVLLASDNTRLRETQFVTQEPTASNALHCTFWCKCFDLAVRQWKPIPFITLSFHCSWANLKATRSIKCVAIDSAEIWQPLSLCASASRVATQGFYMAYRFVADFLSFLIISTLLLYYQQFTVEHSVARTFYGVDRWHPVKVHAWINQVPERDQRCSILKLEIFL